MRQHREAITAVAARRRRRRGRTRRRSPTSRQSVRATTRRRSQRGPRAVRPHELRRLPRLRRQGRHGPEPHRQLLALRRRAGVDLQVDLRGPAAGHAGMEPGAAARTTSGSSSPTSSRWAARFPPARSRPRSQGDRARRQRAAEVATRTLPADAKHAQGDPGNAATSAPRPGPTPAARHEPSARVDCLRRHCSRWRRPGRCRVADVVPADVRPGGRSGHAARLGPGHRLDRGAASSSTVALLGGMLRRRTPADARGSSRCGPTPAACRGSTSASASRPWCWSAAPSGRCSRCAAIAMPATRRRARRCRSPASQWWWAVRYASTRSARIFTTANEIHIPVGGRCGSSSPATT